MGGNSIGALFKVTTWGESHGRAVGAVVDGCPPRMELSVEDIQRDLERRRPGRGKGTSPRKEEDRVEILSGVHEGRTTGTPISLSLSQCGVDVPYVNKLTAKKPTILVVNYTNPWVINEVYNDKTVNIKGVLATFGTTADALLDVITGKFNPSGKMPFSTPVSDLAVENQKEDVPGYLEGEGYALFNYDEGLSYVKK